MSYDEYINEWNGRQVTQYGAQCVAGVAEYEAETNRPIVWGDACKWINHPVMLNAYDWVNNNPNDPNQLPNRGDIIVWSADLPYSGGSGHIAFFDRNLGNQKFMSFGQNSGGATMHFQPHSWQYVAGWYTDKHVEPPPPPTPVVVEEPKASYTFERFDAPMRVSTKVDANVWDLGYTGGYSNAHSNGVAPAGTVFTAVGKATKQDIAEHPVYFMSNESFGQAELTGTPNINQGVNTADLQPAPEEPQPQVAVTVSSVNTGTTVTTDNSVEVKVIPALPDAWKRLDFNDAGDYKATANVEVRDLEGIDPTVMQLIKGQNVLVAGSFTKDGIKYYLTKKSLAAGIYRGIPVIALDEDGIFNHLDDMLISDEIKRAHGELKQRVIKATAMLHGDYERVMDVFKHLKKRK